MDDKTWVPEDRIEELLANVTELSNISELLDDENVNQTLAHVVSLMSNPNVPASVAAPLVVKLEAMGFAFNLKAKNYMLLDKSAVNASQKKNLYLSLAQGCTDLAGALKYVIRTY